VIDRCVSVKVETSSQVFIYCVEGAVLTEKKGGKIKEWSRKPSFLLKTGSSPLINTGSFPVSLTGGTSTGVMGDSSKLAKFSKAVFTKIEIPSNLGARTVLVNPLSGGTVIGVVGAGLYGISNLRRYIKREKSGKQAVRDTVKNSAGLGVSGGLGIAAANAITGTVFALGSTVVVPLACGVTVTFITKKIWNKLFSKAEKK